jgi:hypothetical protein
MKLLKLYGLPRSGTNLLNFSMSLNFEETTCGFGEHNLHYLGWKHGKPSDIKTIKAIENISNVDIRFIFIVREFESWKEAILNRHLGNWEFPHHTFSEKEGEFLYSTPMGYELYQNIEHFYVEYTNFYKNYAKKNTKKCILVSFEELQKDQIKVMSSIKDKFELSLIYDDIINIKKTIQMSERL